MRSPLPIIFFLHHVVFCFIFNFAMITPILNNSIYKKTLLLNTANLFISLIIFAFILCLMSVQLFRSSSTGHPKCGSIIVFDKFNAFFAGMITFPHQSLIPYGTYKHPHFKFHEDVHVLCCRYYCKIQLALLNILFLHYIIEKKMEMEML